MLARDRGPQKPRNRAVEFLLPKEAVEQRAPVPSFLKAEFTAERVSQIQEELELQQREGRWVDFFELLNGIEMIDPDVIPQGKCDQRAFGGIMKVLTSSRVHDYRKSIMERSLALRALETFFPNPHASYKDTPEILLAIEEAKKQLNSYRKNAQFSEIAYALTLLAPARRDEWGLDDDTFQAITELMAMRRSQAMEYQRAQPDQSGNMWENYIQVAGKRHVLYPDRERHFPFDENVQAGLHYRFEDLAQASRWTRFASLAESVYILSADYVEISRPGKISVSAEPRAVQSSNPLPVIKEY